MEYLIEKAIRLLNKGTIEELKKLKEELYMANFDAPLKPMMNINKLTEELSEEEAKDLKKQINYFRYMAYLKKSIYRQVQIAIAARKLYNAIDSDLREHIPLNGNYIYKIIEAGDYAIFVYKRLNDILDKYAKEEVKYIQKEDGARKIHTKRRIIRSKAMRIVLTTAIATYSYSSIPIKRSERLEEYNKILQKYRVVPDAIIDHLEGFEELKEELKDKGFMDPNGETNEEVMKEILTIKGKQFREAERRAILLMLSPMLKFYLNNNKTQRKNNPLWPGLREELDEENIEMFEELGIIDKELEGISKALSEKLRLEDSFENKELSCYLINKYTKKDLKWACEYLKGDLEKAKKVGDNLAGKAKEFLEALEMQKDKKD